MKTISKSEVEAIRYLIQVSFHHANIEMKDASIQNYELFSDVILEETGLEASPRRIKELYEISLAQSIQGFLKNETKEVLSVFVLLKEGHVKKEEIKRKRSQNGKIVNKPEHKYWLSFFKKIYSVRHQQTEEDSRFYQLNDIISHHPQKSKLIDLTKEIITDFDFPVKMVINGNIVENPIYRYINDHEIQKIKEQYGIEGSKLIRIMPLDLFLIKGVNDADQPMIFTYYSGTSLAGWQTWLIPHRGTDKESDLTKRFLEHARDIETLIGLEKNSLKLNYMQSNDYLISIKPDFGYGGLVLYLFFFCYAEVKNQINDFFKIKFSVPKGTYIRKFQWFHCEELLHNIEILKKNADVMRAIHSIYGTSLEKVPTSIKTKIQPLIPV